MLGLVVTSTLTLFAGSGLATARRPAIQEEMRWHGWVPGGQVVEINNIHGDVRAEEASGDEIEVTAVKRGLGDPSAVAIEVVEHKGGVTICAVYPNANPEHPFECRPSRGGGFRLASVSDSEARIRWDNGGGGDILLNNLSVDFVVRLPRHLRLIARTVDGEVSAHLLEQDVDAHSVRGDVTVDMNPSLGADVRAETAMGEVDSAFPLPVRLDPNRGLFMAGHVGHAHRLIRLKTGTGNIHLDRALGS